MDRQRPEESGVTSPAGAAGRARPSPVAVVVPAYNEEEGLAQVLAGLVPGPWRVIVVDDASSDDTARVARSFPVDVVQHACNLGQGAALQTGIEYALRCPETELIVTFDADGQHDPTDIPRLLSPLRNGTHQVTLGTRFLLPGHAVNMPGLRRWVLRLAVRFTRWSSGLRVTDTHNGLRAFTVEVARRLRITQNRMAHASEILTQIAALRVPYCEVPVTITYTPYSLRRGQSIFNSVNILFDMLLSKLR
jgi:glycosyltransferase involved in cell wall biosynthesis